MALTLLNQPMETIYALALWKMGGILGCQKITSIVGEEKGKPMSDTIRREDVLKLAKEGILISNDMNRYAREIINLIPTAEPKEYVKDGTLTVQMPTIKEAKAIDRIVVYADTYKQEYYMPLPNVGKWKIETEGNGWNEWYVFTCPFCGARIKDKDYHEWDYNYCPNCGAKMERSE